MEDTKGAIPVFSLNAVSLTSTSTGTGAAVDLSLFDGALMIADIGKQLDTLSNSNYGTLQFQECDVTTPGSFTDIAAADLLGGDPTVVIDAAAEDELVIYRTYIGSKRYVRMIMTVTGTLSTGWPCSFVVVKMYPRHAS